MAATDPNDRRQSADRRNPASRRRHADSRRLHIELCHSVLRTALVVDNGPDDLPSLKTGTVSWRRDADDLMGGLGRAELAAALRSIVANDRLAGCSVSLAISSTLCVNRATSGASARVEQDLDDLRERSQLYLSLGPGPKTSAVDRKQIDARHEHALMTVTNERTLEMLVEAAESAGLVVDVVESALVALSRLHGRLDPDNTACVLLAQLDERRFEIGVSRQGQLLLEYRPAADATVAQLGGIIDDHLERLQRFCARQYGVSDAVIDSLWLVGEESEVAATNARTKLDLETGVLPLERLTHFWRIEQDEPITPAMGAALGLALRNRGEDRGVSPNLMDEIHGRAKAPVRPVLFRSAAPIAATLLIAAGMWLYNLEQRSELNGLRDALAQAAPAHLRGQRLAQEITDAATEIDYLGRLAAATPIRALDPIVRRLGQCLPEDVWLKAVKLQENDRVSLSGASYTESGVYDLVRYLEEAPDFHEVALRGTGVDQTAKGPATSFDIDLVLAPAAPAPEEDRNG